MKKILLFSALSVAVLGMANAQFSPNQQNDAAVAAHNQLPQVRAKSMVAKISSSCNLEGAQIGKVNQLYIEHFTKLDSLKGDVAKIKELEKTTAASLKGILNSSQWKLWQESAK